MAKTVLLYAQDPGGTRYLAPVFRALRDHRGDMRFVAAFHPKAAPLLDDVWENPLPLPTPPLSIDTWQDWLTAQGIDGIVATSSSVTPDPSNGTLVQAARRLGVPSLGFLDHWKGYDRFLDSTGRPSYLPDWLGVPDSLCTDALAAHASVPERVAETGHPGLEALTMARPPIAEADIPPAVILVGQPVASKGYAALFSHEIEGETLFGHVVRAVEAAVPEGWRLFYRGHPGETDPPPVPDDMIDRTPWSEVHHRFRVFIGLDSMLLLEASLLKRRVITLELPELRAMVPASFPFPVGQPIHRLADLADALEGAVSGIPDRGGIPFDPQGSLRRSLDLIGEFAARLA